MAKGSSNKHQRLTLVKHKLEKIDRISSLPDGLLCHVLSFLQTKEAAATSVLSTRWRSLWKLVPSLDIDDRWSCLSEHNFATIVGRILDQRKAESIKSICLESYHERSNPEFIASFISSALKEKLEELDLALFLRPGVILPSMLFTCESITVLKLEGKINLNVPPSVHFPKLKVLHLFARYFVDDEPITRLISGCPSLEELCCMNANIDRISVPSLKILIVESHGKTLEIDTPSLEIIRVSETKVIDYEVKSLEKLAEADIDIFFDHEDEKENIHKLFDGLHKTKYLSFTTRSTEVLIHARINFPEFHNLVHLQLYLVTLGSNFIIQQLLDNSPKLRFLELEKVDESHECEIEWTEPTIPVPSCLSSHLTKFTFREYGCSEEELKLVGYFLKNAKVLEKAIIKVSTCLEPGETGSGVAKLCMIPKGSKNCRIDFKLFGLD